VPSERRRRASVASVPAGQPEDHGERDERYRGDDRVPQAGGDEQRPRRDAVPGRVPVDAEPRQADHGERRGDDGNEDPADQRRLHERVAPCGPGRVDEPDREQEAGEVGDRERQRDADVRGDEPAGRRQRAEQRPEPGRDQERGPADGRDDAGEDEQRERQEPAGHVAGDAAQTEDHTRSLVGRGKRFVVARTTTI